MAHPPPASGIVPAQLGFLAIYCPSLGTTDETVADQIVYYASATTARRRRHGSPKSADVSREERNERLRQIGLAQAMVDFGRSFSGGQPVDSVDTERSRVVLHELEPGWWILASIDLTRLPLPPSSKTAPSSSAAASSPSPSPSPGTNSAPPDQKFEYSSREVKLPSLLQRDLLRAHALFLLLNSHPASTTTTTTPTPTPTSTDNNTSEVTPPTLASLLTTSPSRADFASRLARHWDAFLSTWNVLLHGNPACAALRGVKVAACGELGVGVGEEDRGSSERAVLEGLAAGHFGEGAGVVDLVVGRYGSAPLSGERGGGGGGGGGGESKGWIGMGEDVGAEDGVVFTGVGSLSRRSVRDVVAWMEEIYIWGEAACGVGDGGGTASASRVRKRRTAGRKASVAQAPATKGGSMGGHGHGRRKPSVGGASAGPQEGSQTGESNPGAAGGGAAGMDKMMSYLKLGYGTYWSLGTSSPATLSDADEEPPKPAKESEGDSAQPSPDPNAGYFLRGLDDKKPEQKQAESLQDAGAERFQTVTVELEDSDDSDNQTSRKPKRTAHLRPIIYVHRPFIFIILLQPTITTTITTDTPSGNNAPSSWPTLSQTLQTQLSSLHKRLLASTAYRPAKPTPTPSPSSPSTQPLTTNKAQSSTIYDLVFDPRTLTIHSTIPNIPDYPAPPPATFSFDNQTGSPPPPPWTRVEALSTHAQILSMLAAGGSGTGTRDGERTCKTSRGWWVVWSRVEDNDGGGSGGVGEGGRSVYGKEEEGMEGGGEGKGESRGSEGDSEEPEKQRAVGGKEIVLIRRASDHSAGLKAGSASYIGGGVGWADGASRLAQGIGVDTRRYIEGLLSLNR